jgi:hypothetical protein
VTVLRRPAPRFVIWAALLVGVAMLAAYAELSPWLIVMVEFLSWVLVAIAERSFSGAWTIPRSASEPGVSGSDAVYLPPEQVESEPAPAVAVTGPAAEPVAEPIPEHQLEPALEPAPVEGAAAVPPATPGEELQLPAEPATAPPPPPPPAPAPALPPGAVTEPVRWNVWTLDRVLQEQDPDNDELGYLVVYLLEYADPSGLLPADFDPLVRESFGALLPSSG